MVLRMEHISKQFPGVKALDDVSLHMDAGDVLALVGENGAGKSTLMKILSGAYTADAGEIYIDEKPVTYAKPADAMEAGIRIIYQELNNLPFMSVAENIFLGQWPKNKFGQIDYAKMKADCKVLLERVALDIDPFCPVETLSVAQKQLVEIAKALSGTCKVLVMDEPTSSLNETETQNLFKIIRSLTDEGKAIIYISHRMDEIFTIANKVQVMRDGQLVGVSDMDQITREEIIRMMVGREIVDMYPKNDVKLGNVALEVTGLTNAVISDVSFNVRRGEILGLFGLMGAGRTNILEAIYGVRKLEKGEIRINGEAVTIGSPQEAMAHKIAYLPSERKLEGLLLDHSVADNIILASIDKRLGTLKMNLKKEYNIADRWIEELSIKTPSKTAEVQNLSGGNQQKVVLAKALETEPEILFLNEPTRGIDVGAKIEIYNLIEQLCEKGIAVVMISSEIPEIMGIADRIVVVCEGHITGELKREEFDSEKMMNYAIGGEES